MLSSSVLLLALAACVSSSQPGANSTEVADHQPALVLRGLLTHCLLRLDYRCAQRRALLFVDRLSRLPSYPLASPWLELIRAGGTAEASQRLEEDQLLPLDSNQLTELIDQRIDQFYESHVFRLVLPSWAKDSWATPETATRAFKDHVDLYFGEGQLLDEDDEAEEEPLDNSLERDGGLEHVNATGRLFCSKCGGGGKKKKKGMKKAGKMAKKCAMMALMMICGKAMLLMPFGMMMMKGMAIKAFIMSKIALLLVKIMVLKKMMQNKGMKGMMMMMPWKQEEQGWKDQGSSGGGGGWDTSSGGGDGGYVRRTVEGQSLAYRGHYQQPAVYQPAAYQQSAAYQQPATLPLQPAGGEPEQDYF